MKMNKISSNARKAFSDFKEEIAEEIKFDGNNKVGQAAKNVKNKIEDLYTNLGRS
ncbi:hypothetical protein [Sporosalibacterium faouarense]|uniref:hypothetical protein n=1 Tax=Sporosalibacterium faouarense TaxID=516123 RepID=UPI00192C61AF|nr:hypothetical protein [Sporosalibacterium faouarense]